MQRSNDAVCAIMAGGSGTRFWPLSRFDRPKQMLALGGDRRTLLRTAFERAASLFPLERILVVTAQRLAGAVATEIPELPTSSILGEPVPRSTAPCLAWAAARAMREFGDVPIAAVAADHAIAGDAAYAVAMSRAVDLAREGWIATFGVPPDRPETGYGYVRAAADLGRDAFAVDSFIEKPDAAKAERLVREPNVFWNSGMFVFSAARMLAEVDARLPATAKFADAVRQADPALEPAVVAERFPACESISIDHAVMERAERVAVVVARFEWDDVGSWDAAAKLADLSGPSAAGPNVVEVVTAGAKGTFVRSDAPGRRVVAVVGVDDLMVVDTGDALLVCRRGAAQDVRSIVDQLRKRGLDDLL